MVKYFPGISALIEREGLLKAQGAMLSLFTCLRLSHNAVGHRRMLKKLAQDCQCSADETFYSPYLSKTLGIGRKQKTLRGRARYNEDNDYNEDDNHKIKKAAVRVSYATHTATPVGPSASASWNSRDSLSHAERLSPVPQKNIFRTPKDYLSQGCILERSGRLQDGIENAKGGANSAAKFNTAGAFLQKILAGKESFS